MFRVPGDDSSIVYAAEGTDYPVLDTTTDQKARFFLRNNCPIRGAGLTDFLIACLYKVHLQVVKHTRAGTPLRARKFKISTAWVPRASAFDVYRTVLPWAPSPPAMLRLSPEVTAPRADGSGVSVDNDAVPHELDFSNA